MVLPIYNPGQQLIELLRLFGTVEEMPDHIVFRIPDVRCRIRLPTGAEKKRNREVTHMFHIWSVGAERQQHMKAIKHRDGCYLVY